MKIKSFFVITIFVFLLTSCWTNKIITVVDQPSRIIGNQFDELVGKSQVEILQIMSAPDRIIPDGDGGNVLVYEDVKVVTNSNTTSSTNTNVTNGVIANNYSVYGMNGMSAYGTTNSNTIRNNSSQSVQSTQKKYVNFFMNEKNVCYNYNANYGELYSEPTYRQDCVRMINQTTFDVFEILSLIPPITLFTCWTYFYLYGHRNDVRPCR